MEEEEVEKDSQKLKLKLKDFPSRKEFMKEYMYRRTRKTVSYTRGRYKKGNNTPSKEEVEYILEHTN